MRNLFLSTPSGRNASFVALMVLSTCAKVGRAVSPSRRSVTAKVFSASSTSSSGITARRFDMAFKYFSPGVASRKIAVSVKAAMIFAEGLKGCSEVGFSLV